MLVATLMISFKRGTPRVTFLLETSASRSSPGTSPEKFNYLCLWIMGFTTEKAQVNGITDTKLCFSMDNLGNIRVSLKQENLPPPLVVLSATRLN